MTQQTQFIDSLEYFQSRDDEGNLRVQQEPQPDDFEEEDEYEDEEEDD